MAAFERAASEGADGVELDVRLSRDGVVVVAHDPELSRVSGGTDDRAVCDVSSSDLERVDLGDGQGVPRLTDVLRLAAARNLLVNVEVKRDVPDRRALVRTVADVLAIWPDARRTIMLSTFDPAMMLELRARLRGRLVAMLVHAGQRKYHPWRVAGALAAAIHPERLLVTVDDVRRARATGHVVNVWTVNDPIEARDLAAAGVDGLITDVPGAIGEVVRGLRGGRPVVF
jgi:glycerophosphoryl diester phosphodiesterase